MLDEDISDDEILLLCQLVARKLSAENAKLVTIESCTGGGIAHHLTRVTGSSNWFDRGMVTYCNQAKTEMVEVSKMLLDGFGAVSIEVAEAMAVGGLQNSRAHYAVSVTGIAGPDGGSIEKPVGTVCFGYARKSQECISVIDSEKIWFGGAREDVRNQSIAHGLRRISEILDDNRIEQR